MPFRDDVSERICKARTVTEGNVHIALPEKCLYASTAVAPVGRYSLTKSNRRLRKNRVAVNRYGEK